MFVAPLTETGVLPMAIWHATLFAVLFGSALFCSANYQAHKRRESRARLQLASFRSKRVEQPPAPRREKAAAAKAYDDSDEDDSESEDLGPKANGKMPPLIEEDDDLEIVTRAQQPRTKAE
ncbi:MAG: hypothetical protein VYC34_00045, partial [Planctomycetota bacterium]|nr:hypothetical protein [Planctomycetota bacterium]